ncbi:MAG: HlyD family efflux transporter periplasmic adaptor subunit [Lachnospiraceae bacterium]|nr:HlyD family efflux transporter periplasmic adaptor subunit [Lachnospiraceae bacterium]
MKEFISKNLKTIIAAGGGILVGVLLALIITGGKSEKKETVEVPDPVETISPSPVETPEQKEAVAAETITATGVVTGAEIADVTSEFGGITVSDVYFSVGDSVNEGDVIAQFDTSDLQAKLVDAKTKLAAAEEAKSKQSSSSNKSSEGYPQWVVNYINSLTPDKLESEWERYQLFVNGGQVAVEQAKNEWQEGTGSKEAYEKSVAELADYTLIRDILVRMLNGEDVLASASSSTSEASSDSDSDSAVSEARLEVYSIESKIDSRKLLAPMSGVITELNISAGQAYSGGSAAKIEDISDYEIAAKVDSDALHDINEGMAAILYTDAGRSTSIYGTVSRIDESGSEYNVYIAPAEAIDDVKSGMTIDIEFVKQ